MKMVEINCKCGCGKKKMVREADRKRGWGLFYNKKCKARWQNKSGHGQRQDVKKMSKERRYEKLQNAFEDGKISNEYYFYTLSNEYPEFMESNDYWDVYVNCEIHPFSDEAFG